ncbi:hypothetical protein DFH08DRAFT_1080362 [Mycena albidolilacea]|uniref:Ricin B lectin domain-containing protein n=1 Tax=Mycena albidolilacea TaxID=1033008 RepID=A0AAD7A170_9AGAR|nr:hypothetical protein DFH08DRAFT_1080362 [Mycena albidolilacea]
MVAPICFVQALVFITNYQGHVLHVANDINPTVRPIVAMPRATPTIANQLWDFIPINFPDNTQFIVESSQQTEPPGIFLGVQTPASPHFVQASGQRSSLDFNLVQCINSTAGAIIEPTSGLALTAWPIDPAGTATPVTYETYTGVQNQIWDFVKA